MQDCGITPSVLECKARREDVVVRDVLGDGKGEAWKIGGWQGVDLKRY